MVESCRTNLFSCPCKPRMVRVLARLNGTDRPTVEISINAEAEANTGIPLRLTLVELAQQELRQQRFVGWEDVGVYNEGGVPVDAASLEENHLLYTPGAALRKQEFEARPFS